MGEGSLTRISDNKMADYEEITDILTELLRVAPNSIKTKLHSAVDTIINLSGDLYYTVAKLENARKYILNKASRQDAKICELQEIEFSLRSTP